MPNVFDILKDRNLLSRNNLDKILSKELEDSFLFNYNDLPFDFIKSHDRVLSTIAIAVSPDGRTIASTHGDHTVKVFSMSTHEIVRNFHGHPRTPWTVKYNPADSDILASGCLGYEVRIWDIKHGICLHTIRFDSCIITLSFHPKGDLVMISSGPTLHTWDWREEMPAMYGGYKKSPYPPRRTIIHSRNIRAVIFHPNGKYVFAAAPDPPQNKISSASSAQDRTDSKATALNRLYGFLFEDVFERAFVSEATRAESIRLETLNTVLPEIHLYSDGGLDISKDGRYLITGALAYIPVAPRPPWLDSTYLRKTTLSSVSISLSDSLFNSSSVQNSYYCDNQFINIDVIQNQRNNVCTPLRTEEALNFAGLSRLESTSTGKIERKLVAGVADGSVKCSELIVSSNISGSISLADSNCYNSHLSESSSAADSMDTQRFRLLDPCNFHSTHSSTGDSNNQSLANNEIIDDSKRYNSPVFVRKRHPEISNHEDFQPIQQTNEGSSATPSNLVTIEKASEINTCARSAASYQQQYKIPTIISTKRTNADPPILNFTLCSSGSLQHKHQPGLTEINDSQDSWMKPRFVESRTKSGDGNTLIHLRPQEMLCLFRIYDDEDSSGNIHLSLVQHRNISSSLMKAVTSIKFSPTGRVAVLGYGVRKEGAVEDHPSRNAACEIIKFEEEGGQGRLYSPESIKSIALITNPDDEVNIAHFQSIPGSGIVYGTKQGRVRMYKHKFQL